jgi:hypothetical protein
MEHLELVGAGSAAAVVGAPMRIVASISPASMPRPASRRA